MLSVEERLHPSIMDELFHVRLFYEGYFSALEGQNFAEWPRFFTDNSSYTVQSASSRRGGYAICDIFCDSKAMICDRANALNATSLFEQRFIRYFLGAIQIKERGPERLNVETSYLAIESVMDEAPAIFSVGRTIDVVERTEEGFLFSRREVVYDHTSIRNSLIFPL